MKKVLKSDQEVYIGLDNPMLLGEDAIWIVVMMCMPVTLLLAFLLPWNQILPFAALDNLTLGLCVYMVTNGNILRMFILYIAFTPAYLWVATTLAPTISALGIENGIISEGTLIASAGMDCPIFVYAFSRLFTFLQGQLCPAHHRRYLHHRLYLHCQGLQERGSLRTKQPLPQSNLQHINPQPICRSHPAHWYITGLQTSGGCVYNNAGINGGSFVRSVMRWKE